MKIGVCDNHDSGAVLYSKKIESAVNEERLSRKKLTKNFPSESIKHLLKQNVSEFIVASKFTPINVERFFLTLKKRENTNVSHFNYLFNLDILYQSLLARTSLHFIESAPRKLYLFSKLKKKISFVDHHFAHAAASYYTSGFKKALIITMDGLGDGLSLTINIGKHRNLKRIYSETGLSAVSSYFSRWTEYLGLKPNKDEGKIVGLAAKGNPEKLLPIMRKQFYFNKKGFNKVNYIFPSKNYKKSFPELKRYSKEDIAASVQKNFELEVSKFVQYWIKKTGIKNLCLSGGAFSNIKLNQRLHELDDVSNIYIFPHMGDGGLALGAILAKQKPSPFEFENLYLGPEYNDKEVEEILKKHKLKYRKLKNIEDKVALYLSKGKIVSRFNGRMEYGPRALGNRSILFHPSRKESTEKLNKNLKRPGFMPLAPTILKEKAKKCIKNLKGAEYTSRFMTITFKCTKWMQDNCPAVVHVDRTVRPQILNKSENPSFYKIIKKFMTITGIPLVGNTSFNVHGEPIVCSPDDAVRTFKKAKLDYMAINDYLVEQ